MSIVYSVYQVNSDLLPQNDRHSTRGKRTGHGHSVRLYRDRAIGSAGPFGMFDALVQLEVDFSFWLIEQGICDCEVCRYPSHVRRVRSIKRASARMSMERLRSRFLDHHVH